MKRNFFRRLKGQLNPFILTPHHMRIQRNNFKGIFRTHDSLHSPPKLRLKFPIDVILIRTHTITPFCLSAIVFCLQEELATKLCHPP